MDFAFVQRTRTPLLKPPLYRSRLAYNGHGGVTHTKDNAYATQTSTPSLTWRYDAMPHRDTLRAARPPCPSKTPNQRGRGGAR
eukprot:1535688-Lingulodinium_polyedra.AAC.1